MVVTGTAVVSSTQGASLGITEFSHSHLSQALVRPCCKGDSRSRSYSMSGEMPGLSAQCCCPTPSTQPSQGARQLPRPTVPRHGYPPALPPLDCLDWQSFYHQRNGWKMLLITTSAFLVLTRNEVQPHRAEAGPPSAVEEELGTVRRRGTRARAAA